MKKAAIEAARQRLQRVRDAGVAVQAHLSHAKVRDAWANFLLSANGIYAKLEQGAKGHGPSEAWWGRKKKERKDDDLLCYLHHARNSEEHTIEGSDAVHAPYATPGNKWTTIENDGMDGTSIRVSVIEGKPLAVEMNGPGIHLLPVRDRGVTYDIPTHHLGQPLKEPTIGCVIATAEEYLNNMISEAEALDPHG